MSDSDWVGATEALNILAPRSSEAVARWAETIVGRVGRGLMPVRAAALFISGERQEGVWPEVPFTLFRAYNLEHNWVTGDFSARPNPTATKPIWFEAYGVQFKRSSIEALLPPPGALGFLNGPREQGSGSGEVAKIEENERGRKPTRGRGGRKPSQLDWQHFAAAFAVVACDDDIDPNASAQNIYDRIADYLNNERDLSILGIESVRDAITLAQAWKSGVRTN